MGFSALFYLAPAGATLAVVLCVFSNAQAPYSGDTQLHLVLYAMLSLLYAAVVVTCYLADYAYIRRDHRSAYGRIDIVTASGTFVISVISFLLRAPLHEALIMTATPCVAFVFSGRSSSFGTWVFRHSLWHAVGGVLGVVGALRHPPEPAIVQARVWKWLLATELALFDGAGVALLVLAVLPAATRSSMWHWGAAHAHWVRVKA